MIIVNHDKVSIEKVGETAYSIQLFGREVYIVNGTEAGVIYRTQKLIDALKKIPDGATIIHPADVDKYRGCLIAGIMEDAIRTVYGIAQSDGIRGFSCSVYYLPTRAELKEIICEQKSDNDRRLL